MRILLTSNRGAGHLGPLFPFARSFLDAGHDVVLAAPASQREMVEAAGVPFHPLPEPPQDQIDDVQRAFPQLTNMEAGERMMQQVFAGIMAQASLPELLRLLAARRPAVVLREPTEYAGLLAAERLAVPHGRIALMAHAAETWAVPLVAPVLDRHRERLGTRYDPFGSQIARAPYLTVLPEAMEDPADTGSDHALRFREEQPAARPLPNWWGDDDRPLVYATYGSVVPTLPGFEPLFRATAAALGALPVRALFTVGNDVDLAALGPVPANVHVERWVPQADVMPHAAAMISHGGAGTTRMALAAGVPAVVVPAIADQPRNAERVAQLGAGIGFGGAEEAMSGLEDAVRRLVEDPSYRAAARAVADEVSALPPVSAAAAALTGWLRPARAA